MSKYERKAQSQRKHGPLSDSGASKAPVAPPNRRPGWKGPSYVKKQVSRQQTSSSAVTTTIQEQLLPVELQQLVLNIFRDTFPACNDFDTLKPMLQEIKDALFQRDFERAFGKEEYLEGYAVRWSPSRTLGYANLLAWLCGEKEREAEWVERLVSGGGDSQQTAKDPARVVCFGGGAAEIMAFAGLLRHLRPDATGKPDPAPTNGPETVTEEFSSLSVSGSTTAPAPALLDLQLVDIADWSSVILKLHDGLTTAPALSKYASAAARASNASFLLPQALKSTFTQANVLESTTEDLRSMIGPNPALLTLLFTLNELYQASIAKTTGFLMKLTTAAPKDSLLLVVDSPGSYSEITAGDAKGEEEGKDKRTFPMHWLMDRALVPKITKKDDEETETKAMWEKVVDEESRWYRLEEDLKYPISLENMRFQVHLFRRL